MHIHTVNRYKHQTDAQLYKNINNYRTDDHYSFFHTLHYRLQREITYVKLRAIK